MPRAPSTVPSTWESQDGKSLHPSSRLPAKWTQHCREEMNNTSLTAPEEREYPECRDGQPHCCPGGGPAEGKGCGAGSRSGLPSGLRNLILWRAWMKTSGLTWGRSARFGELAGVAASGGHLSLASGDNEPWAS